MKYFQFHIGDWLTSTRTLTATERGVYLDLLCLYYGQCKCICKDDAKRLANAYAPAERRALQYVLAEFFFEKNGCFFNGRCEREIKEKGQLTLVRQRAASARWGKDSSNPEPEKTDANASAKAMQDSDANGMPSINHKPITNNQEREREQAPSQTAAACRRTSPPSRGSFIPPEVENGSVDPQAWADFLRIRSTAVSVSFWADFKRQAELAHLSVPAAVKLCAERGWKRLDANWESIKVAESNEDRLKRLMRV